MEKNDNQDLLDLCTLNELEEHSTGTEEEETEWKKAIMHSKRFVMNTVRGKLPDVDPIVEEVHRERNFEKEK